MYHMVRRHLNKLTMCKLLLEGLILGQLALVKLVS